MRECIDSVLCQNYKNIELILVNDGSTDSSKKIIDNYKKTSNNNKGISSRKFWG
ncbi:glycosyltransferase family A protein [Streptococcus infantarius]|uniref:glycosyltransferase family A protein n=1 Tax=Streptococcus infantarius TaxID=102684 RepID=UPI003A4DB354